MEKICRVCNNPFEVSPSRYNNRFSCSIKCYGEYKRQYPDKYNLFKLGHKGYLSTPWLGKKFTEEHKKNISQSNKNNIKILKHIKELGIKHRGNKHWNWKGGITDELKALRHTEEYQFWRNKVYARDNWTCQKCDQKLKNLIAHHIQSFKEYPNLRYDLNNGITLCKSCHKKIHDEIGIKTRFKIT